MAKTYDLQEIEVWDGNMAACHAMRQAQIDVVAAYPITPSTPIVQNYGTFTSNGYTDGEFVLVESEHAAMSACVGASAAGGRVATATSSQGLALMIEVLYQAAGMRLPIVLNLVNRALASPLNIHGDHSDMYLCRDSGWISLCTCNPQEAYDFNLMAFKIAEHMSVRVPVIVNQDGFLCSHTAQIVHPLPDPKAYAFIGDYQAKNSMLNFEKPISYGAQAEEEWHFEHKALLHDTIMKSAAVISQVFEEFFALTGRRYNLVEAYEMDDAEICLVALGTTVESMRHAAGLARARGQKVGVVTVRALRPFPYRELGQILKNAKAIAFLDKSLPGGAMGMLYNEGLASLYQARGQAIASNYIYGLGERDLTQKNLSEIIDEMANDAQEARLTHPLQQFVGLRGGNFSYK